MSLVTAQEKRGSDAMLLIKQAELDAYHGNAHIADVRCHQGLITEIGNNLLPKKNETVIHSRGAALIPGLHDHHIHLLALAAAQTSVHCGPPEVTNADELQKVLNKAAMGKWIRGIQYHESVAGELDRWQLDKWINDRPVRIQHRSGILWLLNSCAIEQLHLENEQQEGLERNAKGQVTGRLFRLDSWLRGRIGAQETPELDPISLQLARFGITGITDTSANNDAGTLALFKKAITQGQLQQRVVMMGNLNLPISTHPMITRGALKILLDEFQLPEWKTLNKTIQLTHQQQRPIAFHCVTEAQLVFALSALEEAGSIMGDRIEHASLCSDEILMLLKKSGASVVTQPGLLHSRGIQYQTEVPAAQHDWLYRCKSFIARDIPLALSSDAPYGPLNPWQNMQAALDRCNSVGYVFGETETLTTEQALSAYLRDPLDLSRYRRVAVGEAADLCLLSSNWGLARQRIGNVHVTTCIVAGHVITA